MDCFNSFHDVIDLCNISKIIDKIKSIYESFTNPRRFFIHVETGNETLFN